MVRKEWERHGAGHSYRFPMLCAPLLTSLFLSLASVVTLTRIGIGAPPQPLGPPRPSPEIQVSPTRLRFGFQPEGTSSAPQAVTVKSIGPRVAVSQISIAGEAPQDFVITAGGAPGPVDNTRTISIIFVPKLSYSYRSATLTIHSNAADSPHTVQLVGTTISGLAISPRASERRFGYRRLGSPGAAQTITIRSIGGTEAWIKLSVSNFVGTNAAGDFQILSGSGPPALALGDTRAIRIRFTPMGLGDRSANLLILSYQDEELANVLLQGWGDPP